MGAKHSPLTEPKFAHFEKALMGIVRQRILFGIAQRCINNYPEHLLSSLDSSHSTSFSAKTDSVMMPTSNSPFDIFLMIFKIQSCPSVGTILLVLASGVEKLGSGRTQKRIRHK